MRCALALALVACGDPAPQPPLVGELAAECSPPRPPSSDELGAVEAPLAWIFVPFPLHDLDCAAPSPRAYDAPLTFRWLDRGLVRAEEARIHASASWTRTAGTCVAQLHVRLLGGPAGLHGTARPCQVVAVSADWASLQDARVVAPAMIIDEDRRELGWPIAWRGMVDGAEACGDAEPVERQVLGLTLVTELALARADLLRLASPSPPWLALGVRVVTW